MQFSLVVFDLDGTLVDSWLDLARSANELVSQYGAAPLDEHRISQMVGEGARVLVERVLDAAGITAPPADALQRFLGIYDSRLLDHTRPYPGVPETLAQLGSTAHLSVLTNKPARASSLILSGLGLDRFFNHVVAGDGPHPRKPAPDGLCWLMQQAGVPPAETLLVGDSRIDLATARNARVQVCLARYGFGFSSLSASDLDGRELILDRPEQLLEWWRAAGEPPPSTF